jgi:hypothetical protein
MRGTVAFRLFIPDSSGCGDAHLRESLMKRPLLLLAAVGILTALAGLAAPRTPGLLVQRWADKARLEAPPAAVLIELGVRDQKITAWSGRATVEGARVVEREGYRFESGDKLIGADAWRAASHRPLNLAPGDYIPARALAGAGLPTVGIVLRLADVAEGATLTVEAGGRPKATVALREVLAGRPQPLWDGRAVVRLVTTTTAVTQGQTEDYWPAACYGPDGTLWLAYVSYSNRDTSRRGAAPLYHEQPKSFRSLYQPGFADQVLVRPLRDGRWGEPIAVTGPHESVARCAVAAAGDGTVWVAYSAFRQGNQRAFARPLVRPAAGERGPEVPLGPAGAAVAQAPALCADGQGRVHAAGAALLPQAGGGRKYFRTWTGLLQDGRLRAGPGSAEGTNHWTHALAAAPDGKVSLAFDLYGPGSSYDVYLAGDDQAPGRYVAQSAKFEARPSLAYDPRGRLWIAFEDGPEDWGKDYGFFVREKDKGNCLYNRRTVRVLCVQDGKLMRPAAELPSTGPSLKALHATRYGYPQIGIDGKGHVWLTYRQNFGGPRTTPLGLYWMTFARRLEGDHWSEPIEVLHSDGLLDSRPALLPHKGGGLLLLHSADGRSLRPAAIQNRIYLSHVRLPGEPGEPQLVPHEAGQATANHRAAREAQDIERMRAYRVESGGKQYRLLRGEFHRHTEISFDGMFDGSLEDMFRYALDAADLDWVGNGDHSNGAGREYTWWLTQKLTDAFHVPGQFTTVFSYERSLPYPNGHRNCLFAKRGVLTLPFLVMPGRLKAGSIHPGDTKMLYRYLKELGGICASHTSASIMGTDWRDNDPAAEPIVEIYQGERNSYEHEDAPRAGHDPKSGELPANIGGWYPKGFVNHALEKGYRLGFQSSSDHQSTHISYFVALVEKADREGILEAAKKRHCYGATDNIVLDVRSGNHLMGDEFTTDAAPALQIHVVGTAPVAKIDILRDSEVVASQQPRAREHKWDWTDPAPQPGTHYYYVRVAQGDTQLAWASPMWIRRPEKAPGRP